MKRDAAGCQPLVTDPRKITFCFFEKCTLCHVPVDSLFFASLQPVVGFTCQAKRRNLAQLIHRVSPQV
jgi:hypothetical protein